MARVGKGRVFTFPSVASEARGGPGRDGWCRSCRTPAAVEQITRTKDALQARGSASADKGPGEQGERKRRVGALWSVLVALFPNAFSKNTTREKWLADCSSRPNHPNSTNTLRMKKNSSPWPRHPAKQPCVGFRVPPGPSFSNTEARDNYESSSRLTKLGIVTIEVRNWFRNAAEPQD